MNESNTHLNYTQACEALGVSRPTLQRYKKAGQVNPIKIGGKVLFKREEINKILNDGTKPKS